MKHQCWQQGVGAITLVAVLTGCAAGTSSGPPQSEPACIRDKTPFSLDAGTYADVGKPQDAKGTSRPFVVVLDERHNSRVGQVEIAIMLNRLYHTANLRIENGRHVYEFDGDDAHMVAGGTSRALPQV